MTDPEQRQPPRLMGIVDNKITHHPPVNMNVFIFIKSSLAPNNLNEA